MSNQTTVRKLAALVNVPVERLLSQLADVGFFFSDPDQALTSTEKMQLLGFLRRTAPATNKRGAPLLPSASGVTEEMGVEVELEDESLQIQNPFDPEKIRVRTVTKTIDLLMRRIKHGEVDLAPEFQRRARIWDPSRKSRLIESILLKIPLPVFYVAADLDENWAVVDGLQRLTTISDFVVGDYILTGLEYLSRFNERRFSTLPRQMQRRIEEAELVIHVIEPGTPESVMINIFKRINTGGISLNGQEIRNALNKGIAREFLRALATSENFKEATGGSVSDARMEAQECALRFCAFMQSNWRNYQQSDLDGFLNASMRSINEMAQEDRDLLEAQFDQALIVARRVFGQQAFRKVYDVQVVRKNPVSKALFEVWTVNLARLSHREVDKLIQKRKSILEKFAVKLRTDRDFEKSISYSTGSAQRVRKRFETVEIIIKEALQ